MSSLGKRQVKSKRAPSRATARTHTYLDARANPELDVLVDNAEEVKVQLCEPQLLPLLAVHRQDALGQDGRRLPPSATTLGSVGRLLVGMKHRLLLAEDNTVQG